MRASIVDVAYSLVDEGGADAVSIREIAGRIQYSVRTIYLYFRDKEAILDAVRERGFAELAAALDAAAAADYAPDPRRVVAERLRRLARAYLLFAKDRAHLFGVMYFRQPPIVRRLSPDCGDPESEGTADPCGAAETSKAFSILRDVVAEYLGPKALDAALVRSVAFALWGVVHGLATLALFEQEKEFRDVDIGAELDRALEALLA